MGGATLPVMVARFDSIRLYNDIGSDRSTGIRQANDRGIQGRVD